MSTSFAKFDFLMAKQKHLSWKFRIKSFLDGEEALTLDQAVSHTDCDLGKWLYDKGFERYKHLSDMKELENIHITLHQEIKNAITLKGRGNPAEAQKAYERIVPISDRIVVLLDNLSKQ
ncbi:MAG: CZB domain-containing protein [Sediminibacterium sp.]|nr:CZB domain-containing protein [Sediminibacterium sp.]